MQPPKHNFMVCGYDWIDGAYIFLLNSSIKFKRVSLALTKLLGVVWLLKTSKTISIYFFLSPKWRIFDELQPNLPNRAEYTSALTVFLLDIE